MSDIFEEVDEAVLHDNAARVWKWLGPIIYVLVATLILGVAGYEVYKWQKGKSDAQTADTFFSAQQALEQNDYALAEALFADVAEKENAYGALASQYLARIQMTAKGDRAAAIESLKAAAEGEGAFADIARLKAAYLMSSSAELSELQVWLEPLASDADSPYAYLAEETIAARAYALGNYEEARSRYNRISLGLDVPQGVQMRAERAVGALDALIAKNGNAS
ncbi:tetratricopeptide repeat protein [Ponticaulis profundi]|uniref:Tetratricopeptide repeat protein n=1 Tax=Ponticaulis profundi TaxID=2665222 RepID=A0ABW1SDL4_9PROT